MGVSINKLAPSAVVVALVGYCIWPSVSELTSPSPSPMPPKKLSDLPASLYAPVMPPPLAKNPWGGKDAETLFASKNLVTPAETTAKAFADGDKDKDKPAKAPINLLAGLTLSGTYIASGERLAVINGAVCAAQEDLPPSVGAVAQIKVAEVLPYSVVLQHDGQTAELTYRNVAILADPSQTAESADSKEPPGTRKSAPAKSGGNRSKKSTK
jgi:hypothetical protein